MAKQKQIKRTVIKRGQPLTAQRKELNKLLDQLNDSEITWVLNQTKTIIHNHKVKELNAETEKLQKTRAQSLAEKKRATPKSTEVDVIQAGSARNFNIVWDNARLFINLNELKSLVKIAQAAANPAARAAAIYRWFQRERKDIIIDGNIRGPGDIHIKKLAKVLNDKFTANS